jgi:hypothetical protein
MIADIFGSMLLWFLGWFMLIGGMIAAILTLILEGICILLGIFAVIEIIGLIIVIFNRPGK